MVIVIESEGQIDALPYMWCRSKASNFAKELNQSKMHNCLTLFENVFHSSGLLQQSSIVQFVLFSMFFSPIEDNIPTIEVYVAGAESILKKFVKERHYYVEKIEQ